MQYVDRVEKMESAIKEKCHEIKKQKTLVKQLLGQSVKDIKDQAT